MFKRCKVLMLRTLKEANITIIGDKLAYSVIAKVRCNTDGFHLYIISDDDIKEGDYFIYTTNLYGSIIKQCKSLLPKGVMLCINNEMLVEEIGKKKKIIATIDTSLTIKGESAGENNWYNPLPQPSQQFIVKYIEEYNKGNVITDVMVEYEDYWIPVAHSLDIGYRPKVNLKDNTITIKKSKR